MPYDVVDAPKDVNMIAVAFPKDPKIVVNSPENAWTMLRRK